MSWLNPCNVTVLAGFAERDGKSVYASHLVAASDGSSGVYRKIHLGPPEIGVFNAGNSLEIFSAEGTQFSIQLCYDAHFPELSTLHALKGAEIIFMPHASPRGTPHEKLAGWLRHLTARAYDNSVFIVASNLAGDNGHGLEFPGAAAILAPSGKASGRPYRGFGRVAYRGFKEEGSFGRSRASYALFSAQSKTRTVCRSG